MTGSTTLTRALEAWATSPQRGDQSTSGPRGCWVGSGDAADPTMVRAATTAILTSLPPPLTLFDVISPLGK